MQEKKVQSVDWKDPLEKEMATHSSILAWEIPWTEEPDGLQSISSVHFSHSVLSDSLPPHGLQHARPPCPSPNSQSLLKLMSIELVMPSNHLILCHSLLLLPSIFPSIRVYLNELALCIRWPKYWSFSFNISSSNEYQD